MSSGSRSITRVSGTTAARVCSNSPGVDHDAFRAGVCGALRGLVGEHREREDPLRAGVSQVEGDLSRLQQRVHRHDHPSGPQHPVVDRRKRRHIRQHDRDPIARLQSLALQHRRDAGTRIVDLCERHFRVAQSQRRPPVVRSRCVDQPVRQIRHRVRLPPGNRITLPTGVEPSAAAHQQRPNYLLVEIRRPPPVALGNNPASQE